MLRQLSSAKTEKGSLIVTFGADYKVTAGTSVDEYINQIPELVKHKALVDQTKVVIEEDVAANSIKITLKDDAIKGSALVDGGDVDGLRRYEVVYPKQPNRIRLQIQFVRNEDGTWDYSKNTLTFLNVEEYKVEKQIEEKRKEVDALYDIAKKSGLESDLEKAKALEATLPKEARDVAYWRSVVAVVEAANAPAPTPAKELKKEAIPATKEEKKTEIQAPNTGFEQTNAIFYILTSGIALAGATYFAIKKA